MYAVDASLVDDENEAVVEQSVKKYFEGRKAEKIAEMKAAEKERLERHLKVVAELKKEEVKAKMITIL